MTVRDFLDTWPENRKIAIQDLSGKVTKDLYRDIASGVPFCLMGYDVCRISAQPNCKVTLFINTAGDTK